MNYLYRKIRKYPICKSSSKKKKKETKNKFNQGVEHRWEKQKSTSIKTNVVKTFIFLKVTYIVHIISATATEGKPENSYATKGIQIDKAIFRSNYLISNHN